MQRGLCASHDPLVSQFNQINAEPATVVTDSGPVYDTRIPRYR